MFSDTHKWRVGRWAFALICLIMETIPVLDSPSSRMLDFPSPLPRLTQKSLPSLESRTPVGLILIGGMIISGAISIHLLFHLQTDTRSGVLGCIRAVLDAISLFAFPNCRCGAFGYRETILIRF